MYVRWGRTVCPSDQGTQLVYSGRAGGSRFDSSGGAANHLCLPDDPDHLSNASGVQGHSVMNAIEYRVLPPHPLQHLLHRNVPCAVCYATTRATLLVIPAKTSCPEGWTREYSGYLMSENAAHARSMFECVDKDPESLPGVNGDVEGHLYLVEPNCSGFCCPPYDEEKELSCVVCSR